MIWMRTAAEAAALLFAVLGIAALLKKPGSVYAHDPSQRNPFEGKKVIFVPDDAEPANADGVRGHLEAAGNAGCRHSFYVRFGKRLLDLLLSFLGLVVLSPVMAVIALAIVVEDPGPVLFCQKRVGENKRFFRLHKFRSMRMDTPHDVPTHQLADPGRYITRVGGFLRAHSLDELPQIWDIFLGNMSVIGPRPALWNQDLLTAERDRYGVNDIRPGLTGLAQIRGRDMLEIPAKAALDGQYAAHVTFTEDLKIFFGSLHVFRKDENVLEGGTGAMNGKENGR